MAWVNDKIIIPSPLKKRDFILHREEEYQIIKFLKAKGEDGFIYRARNTGTNHVLSITLPYEVHHEAEEGKDNYKILELNEDDKEVTLKSWQTGNERKMKVRWDEDVEVIKDGLLVEDKDLFCTLGSIMGKEVIGDFKFMPKDPPIKKMPAEVMDIVFSKLTTEDLLSCRMVTHTWAKLLPIKKFVTCVELSLGPEIKATFHRLDILNHPFIENTIECGSTARDREKEMFPWIKQSKEKELSFVKPTASLKSVYPLIQASLLNDVEELKMFVESRPEHFLPYIVHRCRKIVKLSFNGAIQETDQMDHHWMSAKVLIDSNKGHLKGLHVCMVIREVDLLDLKIGECPSLQGLTLDLSQECAVLRNVQSLPPSLTLLSLTDLAAPLTKSQVLWIARNLPQLEETTLQVAHSHGDGNDEDMDEDEDEIDDDTIYEFISTGPSLLKVSFHLGPSGPEELRDCCGKAKQLEDPDLQWFDCKLDLSKFIQLHTGRDDLGISKAEVLQFLHRHRFYLD